MKVATGWYLDLQERAKRGEQIHGRLFEECAEAFLKHADQIGEVSAGQRRNYRQKWELLKTHFDGVKVTDVDARFLMALRQTRSLSTTKQGKRVTNATLKKDLDFVRLVLKHAKEWEKCIDSIPQFPSFRGRMWKILPNRRPFLPYEDYKLVRSLAKSRAEEEDLNPRTRRQRQELYCFLLICVGAALRVDEAHSLRWQDCQLIKLNDSDQTEAVHMKVFGKHSVVTGVREDAYALYDGVLGFKRLQSLRSDAKPDDHLFLETHRDGMRELLEDADLRMTAENLSRDAKSLRQTGISMRLDQGPSPDYRDIAKWARTSVTEIGRFYDQSHPKEAVERVTGFRPKPKRKPRNEKERKRFADAKRRLEQVRKAARAQAKDVRDEFERDTK